jgi:hypothetical protein
MMIQYPELSKEKVDYMYVPRIITESGTHSRNLQTHS